MIQTQTTIPTKEVIKPVVRLTYSERDVTRITSLKPNYDHERTDFSSLRVWVKNFSGEKGVVENKGAEALVMQYMKENNIIDKDAKCSAYCKASHGWGAEDADGHHPSVYSMEMIITVFKF